MGVPPVGAGGRGGGGEPGWCPENPATWDDIDTPPGVEDGDIARPGGIIGGRRGGRWYQLSESEKLGSGSFGDVYMAVPAGVDGVQVAIKVMPKAKTINTDVNRSHVKNEITLQQLVHHPNVVRLYEPLYSNTHIYMVLELCHTDLKKYLLSRPPLPEHEAQAIFKEFAAGLREL